MNPFGSGALVVPRVYSLAGDPPPRRTRALAEIESFAPGGLVWKDGVVTYVGPADRMPTDLIPTELPGLCVVPGFVDCHTHLPFFGWRADEYAARLSGVSYRDLHGEGGIMRSARMLAGASDDEVLAFAGDLAREMAIHGTTSMELKTGYGLSVAAELRQARLARRLAEVVPQTCTVTLLCHAIPPDTRRDAWVRDFTDELLPAVVAERLADAVDVYVEDIAFTIEDMRVIAEAARGVDLGFRAHADQLGWTGAAEEAVALDARSVDHLNHAGPAGVAALAAAEATAAVLLPASTLMLRAVAPPVREMIDRGAAIAISTDFNPGTSPVCSMPETIALACSIYGLSPTEALSASTIEPAWVLGLDDLVGSLEVGKRADFLVLDSDDFLSVPYRPGHNPVRSTYIGGSLLA